MKKKKGKKDEHPQHRKGEKKEWGGHFLKLLNVTKGMSQNGKDDEYEHDASSPN